MFKILDEKYVMIDAETLSNRANSVIVQLGAVKFDVLNGITDTFMVNIDSADSKKYNCDISKDTLEWWMKQPAEIRKSWQVDKQPLREALMMFKDWYGTDKKYIWCNGASFDYPIVAWSFKECDIELPWKYWDELDVRTISTFFGYKLPKANNHTAKDDATAQANHLLKFFREIPAF
jgi:DNA polymerase III epsilon subunit-like protein